MITYRYTLTRTLDGDGPRKRLCWIMLNPSTATEEVDDPTIRRVKAFTAREGFNCLIVVNLFAMRATKPAELLTVTSDEARGEGNPQEIAGALDISQGVVCAWGAWWDSNSKRPWPNPHHPRLNVEQLIAKRGLTPMCLGTTKSGAPKHPLYVKGDAPLVPFTGGTVQAYQRG